MILLSGFEEKDIEKRIQDLRDDTLADEAIAERHFPPPANETDRWPYK